MRYEALSKLVVLKKRGEREGEERFSEKDYVEQIMNKKLFDF